MHDLDRSDLVFESDGFDAGLEELDDSEVEETSDEVFDDVEQSELATELLSVTDDDELDQFIGTMLKKASRKLRPLAGGVGRNLGSLIKGAVKVALPTVAGLAGTALGGPAGAMVANRASPYLSSLLGLELEGLSPEDQEFESAKQLVRMAGSAIENASNAYGGGSPANVAKQAVVDAARRYAPGLVRGATGAIQALANRSGLQQGTWYRKGNKIILVGV